MTKHNIADAEMTLVNFSDKGLLLMLFRDIDVSHIVENSAIVSGSYMFSSAQRGAPYVQRFPMYRMGTVGSHRLSYNDP